MFLKVLVQLSPRGFFIDQLILGLDSPGVCMYGWDQLHGATLQRMVKMSDMIVLIRRMSAASANHSPWEKAFGASCDPSMGGSEIIRVLPEFPPAMY